MVKLEPIFKKRRNDCNYRKVKVDIKTASTADFPSAVLFINIYLYMSQFNPINSASTHGIVTFALNEGKIKLDLIGGYFLILISVLESVTWM